MWRSRSRFLIFCGLVNVSNATCPSIRPYHIATRWMLPSGPNVAMLTTWRPSRNAATSSSFMRISSRREAMGPPGSSGSVSGGVGERSEQLGHDRAVDATERIGRGEQALRAGDPVDEVDRHDVVVGLPGV